MDATNCMEGSSMKKYSFFLIMLLIASLLSGCAGTPVVYCSGCSCSPDSENAAVQPSADTDTAADAVKTGLYIGTNLSGSRSAAGEESGEAMFDLTLIAVAVDDNGVIRDCVIDSLGTSVVFDGTGTVTSDLTAAILTKNALGENYGMKAASGIGREWYRQAAAFADYTVGKTVEALKNGAVDETGKASDADLASSAIIYLGDFVSGIEAAVSNARHLGARSGDGLRLAVISGVDSSRSALDGQEGAAQLDCDVTALTVRDGVITSCVIDSVQAKVCFDGSGTVTTDLTAPVQSKNQLGDSYGMKAASGIGREWNEQAASFAAYVTGKTAAEVAGIAVSEGKAADADLAASVTVSIGGFQELIAGAMQE